jgi:hypothetical protein
LLTRAHHVVIDPSGSLRARVERVIPLEDGVRLELALDNGKVYAVSPLPGPTGGEEVAVRVTGGVVFARSAGSETVGAGGSPQLA